MPPSPPKILDVTVRDGSFLINHQFSPENVAKIAKALSHAGIQYAEISHGCGIGSKSLGLPALVDDDELLQAAKEAAPDLKFSVFISPMDLALPIIPALVPFFEIGRVGVNVTEVSKAEKTLNKLKKYEKKVSMQLVRSHARPPEFFQKSAIQAEEMGADIIYVVDTFGSMLPADARTYVEAAKSVTKAEIGFHGHNNIGMAIPNTLAAWEAGATWLDASLMGVGKGAGNAVLEVLTQHLQDQDLLGEVSLDALCEGTQEAVLPLFQSAPYSKNIDLLFSLERVDFISPQLLELFSTMLHIPLEDLITNLHAKMGEHIELTQEHIKAVFADHGVDLEKTLKTMNPGPKANE